jgi:voltage-gated potassium channel
MVRAPRLAAALAALLVLAAALPAAGAAQTVEAAPVVVRGDTLFFIQAPLGDRSPADRAATAEARLGGILADPGPRAEAVLQVERDGAIHLVVGETTVHVVTPLDARAGGRAAEALAAQRAAAIERHLRGPPAARHGGSVALGTLFLVLLLAGVAALILAVRSGRIALPRTLPGLPEAARPDPARVAALRRRTHEILAVAETGDRASALFDRFLIGLIALNVVALILETVRPLRESAGAYFLAFEVFSVAVFSAEYLLRLWSAVEEPRFGRAPVAGRVRWARTPLAVIDLLAVLPFYLPFLGIDLRILRAFRLFRLARVFKLGRYSVALQTFRRVLRSRRTELGAAFAVLVLMLLVSASIVYFAEQRAQPDAFSSIPAAMWWAIATLTTVGYGDVVPMTVAGRLAGAGIAVMGIMAFAFPTAILGSAFMEEIGRRNGDPADAGAGPSCPHCGSRLETPPEAEAPLEPPPPGMPPAR